MRYRIGLGLLIVGAFAAGAFAQDSLTRLLNSDVATQRKPIFRSTLGLTGDAAHAFWPVYDEYDKEYTELFVGQRELIHRYAQEYNSLDDRVLRDLVEEAQKIDEKRLALRKKYYKKVLKSNGAPVAARFWQVDRQLAMVLDLQTAARVPLVR